MSKLSLRLPLALAACALGALGAGGCGASHSGTTTTAGTQRPPLESIFEADLALRTNPAATLDALRTLGVSRVKVFMPWRTVAPNPTSAKAPSGFRASDPAAYPPAGWATFDTILRDAKARGMDIDLTIGQPAPDWATAPGSPPGPAGVWKPSAADFGAFMHAVGTRYGGSYRAAGSSSPLPRVDFWGIWNEPNYGQDLAPQAIGSRVELSPNLYRGLLDASYTSLKATGHGSDTILIGELAPRGITVGDQPGNFSGMVPLRFVRALFCADSAFRLYRGTAATERGCPATAAASKAFPAQHPILFHASGFSVHPYPQGQLAPNVPTPIEPDYADLPALPNLERTLDRLQGLYGSSEHFPLYSTEFGYQTNPPEKIARAVSASSAALYLNWAEYISWRDPRIRSYDQYLLSDPVTANASGGFATGLELANGTPKPTYDAYRMPLYLPRPHAATGQAVEVWGCVRPAAYARRDSGAPQTALVEFATGPGAPFRILQRVPITDPQGYFDTRVMLPSRGVVRIAFTPPHGPAIHSRLAAVSIG
ncbi:MAG: polysaccharide biosynthesis protein PslG [Solirubrobacteraceae bacterium]|nr:polysaccharide biosynthesis protein PslG [Solirubrobacteraceae bacterium]